VVICLNRSANLHMAQLMPLPLTVSCFSQIQIGFTFLVSTHPGSPGKRSVKRVCVCACADHCVQTSGHPHNWKYTPYCKTARKALSHGTGDMHNRRVRLGMWWRTDIPTHRHTHHYNNNNNNKQICTAP